MLCTAECCTASDSQDIADAHFAATLVHDGDFDGTAAGHPRRQSDSYAYHPELKCLDDKIQRFESELSMHADELVPHLLAVPVPTALDPSPAAPQPEVGGGRARSSTDMPVSPPDARSSSKTTSDCERSTASLEIPSTAGPLDSNLNNDRTGKGPSSGHDSSMYQEQISMQAHNSSNPKGSAGSVLGSPKALAASKIQGETQATKKSTKGRGSKGSTPQESPAARDASHTPAGSSATVPVETPVPEQCLVQIQLEDGWHDMSSEECSQIYFHLASGAQKFAITARGAMYAMDFTNRNAATQTNAHTRKSRSVRLVEAAS